MDSRQLIDNVRNPDNGQRLPWMDVQAEIRGVVARKGPDEKRHEKISRKFRVDVGRGLTACRFSICWFYIQEMGCPPRLVHRNRGVRACGRNRRSAG